MQNPSISKKTSRRRSGKWSGLLREASAVECQPFLGWLLILFLGLGVAPVMGGELSPYNPPSQRQSVMRPAAVDAGVSAERRQYYADFKREMSTATPEKKKALRAEFIKKLDGSASQDEKAHYQRLVDILSGY